MIAEAGGIRQLFGTLLRTLSGPARWRDALWLCGLAALLRFGALFWAADRFPPAADGQFYDVVARRIANGDGYTWLWPDGVVTYAAHYPVGYPAILGALYAAFYPDPVLGMVFNAALGTLGVLATYWLAAEAVPRVGAVLAAALTALHPSLVLYTPALMTEGGTAALYVIAAWLALRASHAQGLTNVVLLGLLLGLTVLVRPQTLLLVPVFGAAAHLRRGMAPQLPDTPNSAVTGSWWARALLVTGLALLVCAPWTLRNCERMDRCVLVSANGGWNLLIGTAKEADGAWMPLSDVGVPEECRHVFQEALKDSCFGRAALKRIWRDPLQWAQLVPKKWSATFDYPAAPAHYLAESNAAAFDHSSEQTLVAIETVWQRGMLLLALFGFARLAGPRRELRRILSVLGAVSLLSPMAWPAVLVLLVCGALWGRWLLQQRVFALALAVAAATLLIHAIFFGAGRYSLVCGYLAGVLAAAWTIPTNPGWMAQLTPRTNHS